MSGEISLSKRLACAASPVTCLVTLGLVVAPAVAEAASSSEATANQAAQAQNLIDASTGIVKTLEQEPHMDALLKKAKGILVIPQYGSNNDGGPGQAVALLDNGRGWSDPAFYTFRSVNLGPTAKYGSLGSVVLVARDQHALDAFKNDRPFSIGRRSSLTVANYDQATGAPTGHGDLLMWTDLYRDFNKVPTDIRGIRSNGVENQAYYGRNVDASNIMNGSAKNARADSLTKVLPG